MLDSALGRCGGVRQSWRRRPAESTCLRKAASRTSRWIPIRRFRGSALSVITPTRVPGSSELLGTGRAVKVSGTIDGDPFEATLMPSGQGPHWLPLRTAICKLTGKHAAGDPVTVHLTQRRSSHPNWNRARVAGSMLLGRFFRHALDPNSEAAIANLRNLVSGCLKSCGVLRVTHMETVPVRELQQHASAVLRRVRAGERVAVTDRGTIVAVLVPPAHAGGAAGLVAAGRVRRATSAVRRHHPKYSAGVPTTGAVLDDLRADAG